MPMLSRATTLPTHHSSSRGNPHHQFHENLYGDAPFQWTSSAMFSCALATVVTLSTAMYQAKSQDPFDAYPLSNGLSILALLVCFCASMVLKIYPDLETQRTFAWIKVFSGTTALAVLTSVPLHSKVGWPAYPMCGFPLVLLMVNPVKQLFEWIQWRTVEAKLRALNLLSRLFPPSTINLQHALPV